MQLEADIDVSFDNGPNQFIGGICIGDPDLAPEYDCLSFATFVEVDRLDDEVYNKEIAILDSF